VKKYVEAFCLILLICFMYSCASRPVGTLVDWKYEKEAIKLNLKADGQLNLYEGTPHPLTLCVYQLTDPNAFNQLAKDPDQLDTLLECDRFKGGGVAGFERLIVHPGQNSTFTLSRAEGAKYVAVVAGYYLYPEGGVVRPFEIPVIIEKTGFLKLKRVSKPGHVNIDLILGSKQIQSSEEK